MHVYLSMNIFMYMKMKMLCVCMCSCAQTYIYIHTYNITILMIVCILPASCMAGPPISTGNGFWESSEHVYLFEYMYTSSVSSSPFAKHASGS